MSRSMKNQRFFSYLPAAGRAVRLGLAPLLRHNPGAAGRNQAIPSTLIFNLMGFSLAKPGLESRTVVTPTPDRQRGRSIF